MQIIKPGQYFDFMGQRHLWLGISAFVCVTFVALLFLKGLNFGTDFRGGTEVEIAFKKEISGGDVRSAVQKIGFGQPDVVHVADAQNPSRYIIRVQEVSTLSEEAEAKVKDVLCYASMDGSALNEERCPPAKQPTEISFSPGGDKISLRYEQLPDVGAIGNAIKTLAPIGVELRAGDNNPQIVSERDNKVDVLLKSKGDQLMDGLRGELGADMVPDDPMRVEWVGPKAGKLLRNAAIKSVGISLILMMVYIAFRFDMRFAPGAVIALLHDVIIVLGIFVLTKKEFTLTTVAALLTIVGYSINDTVVIFDRIRENLGKHRGKRFIEIINMSVSETLSRTILTSGTTLLTMLSFLWLGTGAIKDFAFAMIIGIVMGTYSSIYVAAPFTEIVDRRLFGSKISMRKSTKGVSTKRKEAVV